MKRLRNSMRRGVFVSAAVIVLGLLVNVPAELLAGGPSATGLTISQFVVGGLQGEVGFVASAERSATGKTDRTTPTDRSQIRMTAPPERGDALPEFGAAFTIFGDYSDETQ